MKEEQRLRDVEDKRARGKGAPKKAKSKGTLCRVACGAMLIPRCYSGQPENAKQTVVALSVRLLYCLTLQCILFALVSRAQYTQKSRFPDSTRLASCTRIYQDQPERF